MDEQALVTWSFLQYQKSSSLAPAQCFLHSMTQIGSKLLLFGGCNYAGDAVKNMFIFDTKTYQWSTLKTSDNVDLESDPGMRFGHAAVLIEMHPPKIMVYGGMVGGSAFSFEGDDTTLEMHVEKADHYVPDAERDFGKDVEDKALPAGQQRSTMQARRKGQKNVEEFDDAVYFLTLNNGYWEWSKPIVRSKVGSLRPMGRTEHTMTKIDTNLTMMFGGWTRDGRPQNDLWTLDYQSLEWEEAATSGIQPRPRYRHSCEVIGKRLYILGGSDNGDDDASKASRNVSSGLSVLNLDTMEWTHPTITGANPFPRSGHASAVVGSSMIAVFGGRYRENVCYNDLFLINVDTFTSILVNAVTTQLPTPISSASLSCIGNKLYCFGGTDVSRGVYNDLRSIDIQEYLAAKDITVSQGAASDYSFKVLIIGDAGVGKSCLLTRFSENLFVTTTTATIGIDFNSRQIKVDGSVCKLEIWDTAGQERFSTITASYYRNAQGALLVYDVGLLESFKNVQKWVERARLLGGEFIEAIIVGNKTDIPVSDRQVTPEQGQQLATELQLPFIETSAKDGSGVDEAFVRMTESIKRSVDRRGLAGIDSSSLEKSGNIVLADGDKKMSMRQKCC